MKEAEQRLTGLFKDVELTRCSANKASTGVKLGPKAEGSGAAF